MRTIVLAFLFLAVAQTSVADAFVDAGDGVRLWLVERGRGTPVVVVHGGPGMDHATLAADLVPLERRHRLVYYDQRGGGLSTLPADTGLLTIDHHVRDLESIRRHLGVAKLTILAHSFGPAIAALYAIRYPGRVERMIFLGPIPPRRGTFREEYARRLSERVTPEEMKRAGEISFETGDAKAACREYWSIMTRPRVSSSLPVGVVKSDLCAPSADAIRYGMTKTNEVTSESMGDWNWIADLAGVRAPVLVIHGEEDAIPIEMVSEWTTALPDARLLRLRETGHFPHAERPSIVIPAIERFLEGRWPRGSRGGR
jgi:proline iminopeptidase